MAFGGIDKGLEVTGAMSERGSEKVASAAIETTDVQ